MSGKKIANNPAAPNQIQSNKLQSLSNIDCSITDFGKEIIQRLIDNKKGDLYNKFVERFLTYVPVDYRTEEKISFFTEFTDIAYKFFQTKPGCKRKVCFEQKKIGTRDALIILILTENKPFIVDTLNYLFSKHNLQPSFLFHPVISTIRSSSGQLQNIVEKSENGIRESIVFAEVAGNFSDSSIKMLVQEINHLIDLVGYTYESWQSLLNKLISLSTNIVHSKILYEEKNLPVDETLDFIRWLQEDHFTFLSAIDFDVETNKITDKQGVGEVWEDNLEEIETIIQYSNGKLYQNKLAMLGKLNKISPIHRRSLVDYILIKQLDQNGKYVRGTIIFGLYGSAIYFQSITSVPILRDKMNYVIKQSEFPVNGYFAKKLKNIIESLPREILIQISQEDLYCMCMHMLSSMRTRKLKLFIQRDWSNSFLNIISFQPRDRLTPDAYKKILNYVSEKFNSEIIHDNITVLAQDFSHLLITVADKTDGNEFVTTDELEQEFTKITTNWNESFLCELIELKGEYDGANFYHESEPALPHEYKYKFPAKVAVEDTRLLIFAHEHNKTIYKLEQNTDSLEKNILYLKIYKPNSALTLSDIMPSIENIGFTAIDEQSFFIKAFENCPGGWIYQFKLESPVEIKNFNSLKENVEEALERINQGKMTSDTLSKLLVLAEFNWQNVMLMIALTRYLHQTGFTYSKAYVQDVLIKHHNVASSLIELFKIRFDKELKNTEQKAQKVENQLLTYLDKIESSAEDKVLRHLYHIIKAIVRTNFYQLNDGNIKEYISFKIHSKEIPGLPLPLPYYEIFVYSQEFEGIHLRGGKVARGGLRWSDRGEDYRTEVLGLMKAQMTKNTVIVPVGSKGAFYISTPLNHLTRQESLEKAEDCYKNFLRGLLDLTDNLVNNKVTPPINTVTYDQPDPYLVVAADKGTATFSDFANEVSKEYNFWLGDAFASGGSAGYDHKKMGITAKGAWISVQTHFEELGIDVQKESITVAGIGDMSGDVFGNGMLLSKAIKLVAAFNHMHIFIDPNPDPHTSYKERTRLFNLPRSKWTDYDNKLISKGGAIFDRQAKILELTPQIQELLDISNAKITPDDLIKAILKARIDLIWNGGIGTYIKASSESHIDIGDKTNDALRINGKDVQAKVIGEGGNLGISQLGRIEYAKKGGHINTDFIDNSAGVDCSDHEVNIKIAVETAIKNKKITTEKRNEFLESMTDEVEELVLVDNKLQNLALTINQFSSAMTFESFGELMRDLEADSLLNREVEFLPDNTEIAHRSMQKLPLTRPELSVILSYSKMAVAKDLQDAILVNDPYYEQTLINYFPRKMHSKLREEILNHPLRHEIILTSITNKLVNQLGGSIINEIKNATGAKLCDIARSHTIVCEIFKLDDIWNKVRELPVCVNSKLKVEMYTDIAKVMRRGISWFVRNVTETIDISKTVNEYRNQTSQITKMAEKLLIGEVQVRFKSKFNKYLENGVDEELARQVALLDILVSAFDILYIAKQTNIRGDQVANLYFATGEMLNIDWLRKTCDTLIDGSFWNRLSIQSMKDDLYDKQRRLIIEIIKTSEDKKFDLNNWFKTHTNSVNIFVDFVSSLKSQQAVSINMLIIAIKKFELLLRKLK